MATQISGCISWTPLHKRLAYLLSSTGPITSAKNSWLQISWMRFSSPLNTYQSKCSNANSFQLQQRRTFKWMVWTAVFHPSQFLIPEFNQPRIPELDFSVKEQDCISLMKRCKSIQELKQVHGHILKLGLFWSPFCASNLLSTCAFSDWGSLEYACSVFWDMDDPGSFDFNTMIKAHVKYMNFEEALFMYIHMLEDGVQPNHFTYAPLLKACSCLFANVEGIQIHGHLYKLGVDQDLFVQNSLINLYGKCREINHACLVFERMDQRTIASWSAMIAAYASLRMWSECIRLFRIMNNEGSLRAEESISATVLSACTHLGDLDQGKSIHGYILRNLNSMNVIVETSLIDMYVKCGCLEKGLILFQGMGKKNHMSYSVIISGLASHGRGEEALAVFTEMLEDGLVPDDVIYVSVLSACGRAGLVKEGMTYFDTMRIEYAIEPTVQHYGCMVDLFGRAGMLAEAFELIQSMPMEPNDIIWRSLLSSCKIHRNLELGEVAFKKLSHLEAHNASDYLMLSNMYAQCENYEAMAMIRTKMVEKGITQVPGSSFVEVNKKMYKFVSQDMKHPQCEGVYEMLHQMEWQLRFEGYKPDTSQVLLVADEDEKREKLRAHSQKLAIAFALVHTSPGSPVRIVRNVRMCDDCHGYTKLISLIYERDIIVKDGNRFHHFEGGVCSCKDYW